MTAKFGTKDSTKIWENSLKKIWNTVERSEKQEMLLTTATRLIHTPPNQLPGWNGSNLPNNNVTLLWAAANNLYGSMWNSKQYELEAAESSDLSNMNTDDSTANLN